MRPSPRTLPTKRSPYDAALDGTESSDVDLDQLANIGEFLGGIAVIVSLVYLAAQIRQNTNSLRASTFQAATDSVTEFTTLGTDESELSRIYSSGLFGTEALSEHDRIQFYFLFVTIVRRLESAFFQREAGIIDEHQWAGFEQLASVLLKSPGGREQWERTRQSFTPPFREFVETLQTS